MNDDEQRQGLIYCLRYVAAFPLFALSALFLLLGGIVGGPLVRTQAIHAIVDAYNDVLSKDD